MSTHYYGEGNIGSAPDYREFPNGNDEPRRLLRLNVYFDNPVPTRDGFEDRGGFWAPVEIWHRDAEHWKDLYQKGMRVLVEGRAVRDEWEDAEENERVTFKIEARRIGILPYRVEAVTLGAKPQEIEGEAETKPKETRGQKEPKQGKALEQAAPRAAAPSHSRPRYLLFSQGAGLAGGDCSNQHAPSMRQYVHPATVPACTCSSHVRADP